MEKRSNNYPTINVDLTGVAYDIFQNAQTHPTLKIVYDIAVQNAEDTINSKKRFALVDNVQSQRLVTAHLSRDLDKSRAKHVATQIIYEFGQLLLQLIDGDTSLADKLDQPHHTNTSELGSSYNGKSYTDSKSGDENEESNTLTWSSHSASEQDAQKLAVQIIQQLAAPDRYSIDINLINAFPLVLNEDYQGHLNICGENTLSYWAALRGKKTFLKGMFKHGLLVRPYHLYAALSENRSTPKLTDYIADADFDVNEAVIACLTRPLPGECDPIKAEINQAKWQTLFVLAMAPKSQLSPEVINIIKQESNIAIDKFDNVKLRDFALFLLAKKPKKLKAYCANWHKTPANSTPFERFLLIIKNYAERNDKKRLGKSESNNDLAKEMLAAAKTYRTACKNQNRAPNLAIFISDFLEKVMKGDQSHDPACFLPPQYKDRKKFNNTIITTNSSDKVRVINPYGTFTSIIITALYKLIEPKYSQINEHAFDSSENSNHPLSYTE